MFCRVRLCDLATEISRQFPNDLKWRKLADLATVKGDVVLVEEFISETEYFSWLLTFYSAFSDKKPLLGLADKAAKTTKILIFSCVYVRRLEYAVIISDWQ